MRRSGFQRPNYQEYLERVQAANARPRTPLKRGRIKPRKTDTDKADALFSRLIREKAAWCCARCGENFVDRKELLECSHFFRRNKYATRYDERNADAFCKFKCHPIMEVTKGIDQEYYLFMLTKLGADEFLALHLLSESRVKLREAKEVFSESL